MAGATIEAAARMAGAISAILIASAIGIAAHAPAAHAAREGAGVPADAAATSDTGATADAGAPTFEARIERASRALLGAPYRLGPLGEGAPPDADPRFRLDAFDCTTYVETVLAIALAGADLSALEGAEEITLPWLDRVRYSGGVPIYAARRHLVEAQWVPQLAQEGLVSDVTRAIGGRATRVEVSRVRRGQWEESRLGRELELPAAALPVGRHVLPYLPWSALEHEDVLRALPAVAILNLIATPVRDAPTIVTHQALLFRRDDGTLIVRHASTSRRRVVEEPLDGFAARSRARRSRSVLGVNVLAVAADGWQPQPAR